MSCDWGGGQFEAIPRPGKSASGMAVTEINIVPNWFEELKERVAVP